LRPYLDDADPGVRATALSVLTEGTPDGWLPPLVAALRDAEARVRRTAAEALRELVEVLPDADELAGHIDSDDPVVRAAVVDVLRARHAGTPGLFAKAAVDPDHRVRIEAARALVSIDDSASLAAIAGDENREVRIAVAHGLATIGGGGVDTVRDLARDRDPLVRAAALAAFAGLGCGSDDVPVLTGALRDSAWQVRQGAARGLAGSAVEFASDPLTDALGDPHLDVRKAAVLTLAQWRDDPQVRAALESAGGDADADVRAYARRAIA
jgi:HEAT repeat protein